METGVQLRHIRYLIAVAEHGNFTRAAESLRVSQPALSQQIRQLEIDLDAQLLDRSGRVVRLTDFGVTYLGFARQALLSLEAGHRALHDVRDLSRGHVRLAFTPTFTEYLVAPVMREFAKRHPAVTIELMESSLQAIESALAVDQIDVAIGFADVRSDDIEVEPLFPERLVLVVDERHSMSGVPGPVAARQLEQLPLALLTSSFVSRAYADDYFRAHRIRPRIVLEANRVAAQTQGRIPDRRVDRLLLAVARHAGDGRPRPSAGFRRLTPSGGECRRGWANQTVSCIMRQRGGGRYGFRINVRPRRHRQTPHATGRPAARPKLKTCTTRRCGRACAAARATRSGRPRRRSAPLPPRRRPTGSLRSR
jgi:LysR family cyn operon transcriptional activator